MTQAQILLLHRADDPMEKEKTKNKINNSTKACKWGMTNLEHRTIQTTTAQVSHSTELLDTKINTNNYTEELVNGGRKV